MTEDGEIFPAVDVAASRRDRRLQKDHRPEDLDEAMKGHLDQARQEALEAGASPKAQWVYFRSPDWTWQALCGREGWLLVDPGSGKQYTFWLTTMS